MQAGDVEASFNDIMENLEAGFMLDYRGQKDKWGVGLDLIYLNINPGATVRGPNPAPVGPPIVPALTAMCNAQLTNNVEDLCILTVHPMGENATGAEHALFSA